MSTRRTAWHYFLGLLLTEKAPRCFEIIAEAPVTLALQHMDWLLLRRRPWSGPPDRGETLVALWPHLPRITIGEYKSDSRQYRRGEIHRLLGYGHQYAADHADELNPGDLAVALMVAARNEALGDDLRMLGCRERSLGGGYTRIKGLAFPMLLIDLTAVAACDHGDYIALFAHRSRVPADARSWWYARYGTPTEDGMDVRQMEEFRAMQQRYLSSLTIEDRLDGIEPAEIARVLKPEQRLAGLDAEQRLAGLDPEQRLAGLDPQQRLAGLTDADAVLAMPDAVLAGLTDAFVDALPDDVRDRVHARRAARAALR